MAITINIPSGGTVVFLRPYGVPGNATTDPSGSTTVTLGSSYYWFTESTSGPYKVTDKIMFTATKNTGTSSRNATVTMVSTTGADSRYEGTASVTCAYTITQAASPEPPTPTGSSIYFSTRGVFSSQSDEPRGRVDIWVNVESSEEGNALDWWPHSTSETNVEDLDIDYSAGYVTVSLSVGVETPPYMAEYTVDVSCNGVTGHGQGGGSNPAFVQIQVPVSVTEGFAGFIDFTVFVRDS